VHNSAAPTLAKTIMVLRNIEALLLARDGVHSTDKAFTILRLDCENQIHAPPRCWGVVMDNEYVQENIVNVDVRCRPQQRSRQLQARGRP
jgi:hypothetical protein